MAIPEVDVEKLADAMRRFDAELRSTAEWQRWQENEAHRYAIRQAGQLYPVKQIVHMATGQPKTEFSGGREANAYVEKRGLTVVPLANSRNDVAVADDADHQENQLKEMRQVFLARMPGFESFPESGAESVYVRQERSYKDEMVLRFRDILVPALEGFDRSSRTHDEVLDALRSVLARSLPSLGGPQNLLGWRGYAFIWSLAEEPAGQFVVLLKDLVLGGTSTPERITRFNGGLEVLLESSGERLSPAMSRGLPTFFLMLAAPDTEIYVKTTEFNELLGRLGRPGLSTGRFDGDEYERVLDCAGQVRQVLEDWDWAPRDMIDVQSFIWVALSRSYDAEVAMEENEAEESYEEPAYVEPTFDEICAHVLETEGIRLSRQTLRRYHLALRSRKFVILAGVSGTGKTWLAQAYADAVGAKSCIVPVAPNWTMNEDLLGFFNPLDKTYNHTQFSQFLLEAAKEAERSTRPYHLILDEMNLARVEHYFARFLSMMELRARDDAAWIDLAPNERVPLTQNLYFIGTVNVDETTHGFADKVYDRAQLIEMESPRDLLRNHLAERPYAELLLRIWDAVNDVAPFAFRVINDIGVYVDEGQTLGVGWEDLVDEQVLQKILPKVKGADPRVGIALDKLAEICGDDMPLTRAKIERMLEMYRQHGFTSYF